MRLDPITVSTANGIGAWRAIFAQASLLPPLQSGGHSSLDPRLPIPNRTVKRVCADDSVQSHAKVGYRQAISKSPGSVASGAFSLHSVPRGRAHGKRAASGVLFARRTQRENLNGAPRVVACRRIDSRHDRRVRHERQPAAPSAHGGSRWQGCRQSG